MFPLLTHEQRLKIRFSNCLKIFERTSSTPEGVALKNISNCAPDNIYWGHTIVLDYPETLCRF